MEKIPIDKVIRSRRRTIALIVTEKAELFVHAPLHVPMSYIERFVLEKQKWISEKQGMMLLREQRYQPKQFTEGEEFVYLGSKYKLHVYDGNKILLEECLNIPRNFLPEAREKMILWYRKQAHTLILQRVNIYSNLTGLSYKSVRITGAEKRYGSCGYRGTLNFTWRLMMAPLEIIDYLVVHELVHTEIKNHSKKFWNRVDSILPEYTKSENWLKNNDYLLRL
jgi:predicted metal-dependent hydrolase